MRAVLAAAVLALAFSAAQAQQVPMPAAGPPAAAPAAPPASPPVAAPAMPFKPAEPPPAAQPFSQAVPARRVEARSLEPLPGNELEAIISREPEVPLSKLTAGLPPQPSGVAAGMPAPGVPLPIVIPPAGGGVGESLLDCVMWLCALSAGQLALIGWLSWLLLHRRRQGDAPPAPLSADGAPAMLAAHLAQIQRAQRAYVHVRMPQRIAQEAPLLHFLITISNAGQTPALEVEHWGGIALGDRQAGADFDYPEEVWQAPSPLAPGCDQTLTLALPDLPAAQDMQQLMRGQKMIVLFGRVRYRDVFGETHTTSYRLIYTGETAARGVCFPAEGGNSAD